MAGSNLDPFSQDLDRLVELGQEMDLDLMLSVALEDGETLGEREKLAAKKFRGTFRREYQASYTEAHAVVRQLIPDRLAEFVRLYEGKSPRKSIDASTYNIHDWLSGLRISNADGDDKFNMQMCARSRFNIQLQILASAKARFESSLFDIRQVLQADLFDSELDCALELVKTGFYRAAGIIAGVVLEKHLAEVCASHHLSIRKKRPTLSDFNDKLKEAEVIGTPTWRHIQHLGDLRNLCGHTKERDPTKDDATELIEGVEKMCKTLF